MEYFLTGTTGFIGRNLMDVLARRGGTFHLLVRPASRAKAERLAAKWAAANGEVHILEGDIAEPHCGLSDADLAPLRGKIDHFFHLAAVYDMNMDAETGQRMNVDGTRHVLDVAKAVDTKLFHHVSSIAVAGRFQGNFLEAMFDEGQELHHPYFKTKHESEKLVRQLDGLRYRIYRPGAVIGHSETGEMDKVDGPYFLFKPIQRIRSVLPQWVPLIGVEGGIIPLVPVDYVVKAIDYLAHQPDLDGRAFHLVDPNAKSAGDALNLFCRAAHAPEFAMRLNFNHFARMIPKPVTQLITSIPALRGLWKGMMDDLGIPPTLLGYINIPTTYDTREVEAVLDGSGIACPPLEDYAPKIWDYWERNLDPATRHTRDLRSFLQDKKVVVTGASSGIGLDVAKMIARYGGRPILIARSQDKLEAAAEEIRAAGGECDYYPADLSDLEQADRTVQAVLADHGYIDILVNNAGKSIRRSVELSYDRFHDFQRTMQLNYFGALRMILGFLPSMRERRQGHIVNVSSIGVQAAAARFSAYVASKSALDMFSRSLAIEVRGDNVRVTRIYMPLVRTPMIEPTKMYRSMPTLTSEEGAKLVVDSFLTRPRTVSTRLGTFAAVMEALLPSVSERIQNLAFKVMPESAAARGLKKEEEEVSVEAVIISNLLRGMHL